MRKKKPVAKLGKIFDQLAKEKAADTRANVTFRMRIDLMEQFRQSCEKAKLSMTSVLERMIEDALDSEHQPEYERD